MRKQITDPKQLIGKTVEKIIDCVDDDIWILFEDNTFCVFKSNFDEREGLPYISFLDTTPEFSYAWMRYEICTPAEFQVLNGLNSLDNAIRRKKRQRLQWERLNRSFGEKK